MRLNYPFYFNAVLYWALPPLVLCAALLAGCFEWSEDQQGNLRSVGVPGLNLWESSKPAATLSPTDLGFTPDQAAQMGGPVLVVPPVPPSRATRYHYYQAGKNHCQQDLAKLLAARGPQAAPDESPYCTDQPPAPETHGSALIL